MLYFKIVLELVFVQGKYVKIYKQTLSSHTIFEKEEYYYYFQFSPYT